MEQAGEVAPEVKQVAQAAVANVVDALKSEQAFGSPVPPKVLDFGAGKASPNTPTTPVLATAGRDEDIDYNQFVMDTLLWRNRVRSALYLLAGFALIFAVHSVLTSKTPFITGVCYVLVCQIGLNSVRAVLAPSMQARATYADSAWTQALIDRIQGSIAAAAALHDVHLSGADPSKTLNIAAFIWLLSIVARHVAATTMLLVVHAGAFTLPVLYVTFKKQIDDAVSGAINKAKAEFNALDRRVKALIILAPTLAVGYLFSTADTFIALVVCLCYGRFALKSSEIEKFASGVNKHTKTITATASKVGEKLSGLATSTAAKYELTPAMTPGRKKTQ